MDKKYYHTKAKWKNSQALPRKHMLIAGYNDIETHTNTVSNEYYQSASFMPNNSYCQYICSK